MAAATTTSTEAPPPPASRAPPSPRKPGGPGQPWSDLETTHLISAYAEKWYSLKRGPLKAQQWEEVALAVAARCALRAPSKNGTQCRHKMEKLRKRYRAERKLPVPSRWHHFHLMDRMERGPLPPPPPPPNDTDDEVTNDVDHDEDDEYTEHDDEEDEDEEEEEADGYLGGGLGTRREGDRRGSYAAPPSPRVSEVDRRGGGLAMQLAASVRRFAEQFRRIEKRRMEMVVELERDWMEMETRRMQMVIKSQQYLVDAISAASACSHPAKKAKRPA